MTEQTIMTPDGPDNFVMRLAPKLPPGAYKTYQILSPLGTHFRNATCDEVECAYQAQGWRTVIDERTDLGAGQARYIRAESGRKFVEERGEDGLTSFTFEPGQQCFTQHKVSLERPEHFLVRGGDWRGDPTGAKPYVHRTADEWTEDFATHQDKIATLIERG